MARNTNQQMDNSLVNTKDNVQDNRSNLMRNQKDLKDLIIIIGYNIINIYTQKQCKRGNRHGQRA